jgi:phosphoketolase
MSSSEASCSVAKPGAVISAPRPVPLAKPLTDPNELRLLEEWLRSYRPENLFDANGALVADLQSLAPIGDKRMGATPHANGGRVLQPLELPDYRRYALEVTSPARVRAESTRQLGMLLRDVFVQNREPANFRLFCPDETNSNRLSNVFETEHRCFVGPREASDDHVAFVRKRRAADEIDEHLRRGRIEAAKHQSIGSRHVQLTNAQRAQRRIGLHDAAEFDKGSHVVSNAGAKAPAYGRERFQPEP